MSTETKRRKRSPEEIAQALAEAYQRSQGGSVANYATVYAYFMDAPFSIPEIEISPKENCLTYDAWLYKGRRVRKGQTLANGCGGCKIDTWRPIDPDNKKAGMRPSTASVFHITQTERVGR